MTRAACRAFSEQDWSEERIRALAGHADPAMTQHCIKGRTARGSPSNRAYQSAGSFTEALLTRY